MFEYQINQSKRKWKFEKLLTKILKKALIEAIIICFNSQKLINFLYIKYFKQKYFFM